MSPKLAVQMLVAERLPPVLGSIPFYDDVPQEAQFPYVTIDDAGAVEIDDTCTRRWRVTVALNVWSRYDGYAETYQIQGLIDSVLAYARGTYAGHRITTVNPDNTQAFRDLDGYTRHGVSTFTAIVEQI